MKKILALALILVLSFSMLVSCGGEEIKFGKKYAAAQKQVDILFQLNAKTCDVGIMDSTMAGYYMSQDSTYANALMVVPELTLATEQYGIAARKGSALAYFINKTLVEMEKEGEVTAIAEEFGLATELCIDTDYTAEEPEDPSDWNEIKASGKLIVGYTLFAPIAYEEDGKLTGFDIELAKVVAAKLELEVEFVIIEWGTKEASLAAKSIDCIWNGMTITPGRAAEMEISIPYLNNKQVAVIRKEDADKYKTTADMGDAIISAEAGSAGEGCVLVAKDEE